MARGWRVVDAIAHRGDITSRRGRLVIRLDTATERELPAEELAVVMVGGAASLSGAALQCLAEHDVTLVVADWRSTPQLALYPWVEHSRVGARHLAQAQLSVPRRKNAWMRLVRAKILGQAANLRDVDPEGAKRVVEVARSVRSGDPANAEGLAARLYWRRLLGRAEPFRRVPGGTDPRNAMLNYGYMVLRAYGVRAVVGAGLCPPLGVFHRGRSNYFNLVDDLIEPFRPAVDREVARLCERSATLEDQSTRHALVAAAGQPFQEDGYGIPVALDELAQRFGLYCEGNLAQLEVAPWAGPVMPHAQEALFNGQA